MVSARANVDQANSRYGCRNNKGGQPIADMVEETTKGDQPIANMVEETTKGANQ
jgi:hypothetical protein